MKYERIFVPKGNQRQTIGWLARNGYEQPDFEGRRLHLAYGSPTILFEAR